MKRIIIFFALAMILCTFSGCENDDTIQTCIIDNKSYTSQKELEAANQSDVLSANQAIYASIHFIESPKGMEYTVRWYLDDKEIKSETKAIENGPQDIIVYELPAEKAAIGKLKLEIIYKETVLNTKELQIQ